MTLTSPWRLLLVKDNSVGHRLDIELAELLPNLSRRAAQRLIADGSITIDGSLARKSTLLQRDQQIEIWKESPQRRWPPAPDNALLLSVIHEDEYLIAVNKPSGIAAVPLSPTEIGTVANAVVARYPECASIGRSPGDGGLLQRLDCETSGLLLVARSQAIHATMIHAGLRDEVEKTYLALVPNEGHPPPKIIDVPLSSAGSRGHLTRTDQDGHAALTQVRTIKTYDEWQLVEATIHRGSRHQIRAHLASAGFPIAGDKLYNSLNSPTDLDRLFLHAHKIEFIHPVSHQNLSLTAPLPPELEKFN
jgi:23S rRNA pseudouridine1911/1915/1917 synthase